MSAHTLDDYPDPPARGNPLAGNQAQDPLEARQQRPNCCSTFFKSIGIIPLLIVCISTLATLVTEFTCLGLQKNFICSYWHHSYFSFSAKAVFERGEVWRLFSAHIWNVGIWQCLFGAMKFTMASFIIERMVGTGYYVLLIVLCILCSAVFQTAFGALINFSMIAANKNPYINVANNYPYWNAYDEATCEGLQCLGLFMIILYFRISMAKTVPFCLCCTLPVWAMILILYIFTQVITYMIWNALFFNVSAVFLAFIIPRKWIYKISLKPRKILTFAGVQQAGILQVMGSRIVDTELLEKVVRLEDAVTQNRRAEARVNRAMAPHKAHKIKADKHNAKMDSTYYNDMANKRPEVNVYDLDHESNEDGWPKEPLDEDKLTKDEIERIRNNVKSSNRIYGGPSDMVKDIESGSSKAKTTEKVQMIPSKNTSQNAPTKPIKAQKKGTDNNKWGGRARTL